MSVLALMYMLYNILCYLTIEIMLNLCQSLTPYISTALIYIMLFNNKSHVTLKSVFMLYDSAILYVFDSRNHLMVLSAFTIYVFAILYITLLDLRSDASLISAFTLHINGLLYIMLFYIKIEVALESVLLFYASAINIILYSTKLGVMLH